MGRTNGLPPETGEEFKLKIHETAAQALKERSGKACGEGLMKFLRTAPKRPPEAKDRIE